jgi:hypothetical protein
MRRDFLIGLVGYLLFAFSWFIIGLLMIMIWFWDGRRKDYLFGGEDFIIFRFRRLMDFYVLKIGFGYGFWDKRISLI